jgi:hypothetical protein
VKLPKNQEPLEPKAPETLQKLKWFDSKVKPDSEEVTKAIEAALAAK